MQPNKVLEPVPGPKSGLGSSGCDKNHRAKQRIGGLLESAVASLCRERRAPSLFYSSVVHLLCILLRSFWSPHERYQSSSSLGMRDKASLATHLQGLALS